MIAHARSALALILLGALPLTARADLSATVTLTSDYLFDGVSQTDSRPALQASLDYGFDNGFYLGTWLSNVDFEECEGGEPGCDEATIEQDWYGGYSTELRDGLELDMGFAYYTYYGVPQSGYDYLEIYAGLTFLENTRVKLWLADNEDYFGGDADGDEVNDYGGGSLRLKFNQDLPLNDDWKLGLEATWTKNQDVDDYYGSSGDDFLHWRVGVATEIEGFALDLSYHDTDIARADDPREIADGRVVFSVSRTLE